MPALMVAALSLLLCTHHCCSSFLHYVFLTPRNPHPLLCSVASAVSNRDKTVSVRGEAEAARAWAPRRVLQKSVLHLRPQRKRAQVGGG